MKSVKIAILSLYCVVGVFFNHCSACDSLEALRNTYKIENNILTAASGQKYSRYPFESKLHFDLTYYMKDLKAAEIVYKAYKNHILPVIVNLPEDGTSNAANEAFSKALIEICLLFGNPKHSPEKPFLCALGHQGNYGLKWIKEHSQVIKDFIEEADTPLYALIGEKKKSAVFTIAIITTTASGGNYSVAESMAALLAKNINIRPILIDVEEIAREIDPVMIATSTYTYDMIYSCIFQKTNDFSVIPGRKKLNREIQQYIPTTLLARLKQKLVILNPDLIISTRSYTSDDIGLSTLGIPFRMFHPDFELCPSLCAYYRNVSADSIRFWIPICRPSMFKPLFENYKRLDIYDEKDENNTLLKKLSIFLNVPQAAFKAQFEVIGYPCFNFFKINDGVQLAELRQKWGIQRGEMPVFIMMGKHGANAIKEIFNNILHSASSLPIKYIFICGKNNALKDELEGKLSESINKNKITILGLLNPKQMNEIMNISLLGISKAGGATVIESVITNRHLLLMHSYPWEEINASYLMEIGLATKYDSKKSLLEQIENCIKKCNSNVQTNSPLDNWQNNLMLNVESCMNDMPLVE